MPRTWTLWVEPDFALTQTGERADRMLTALFSETEELDHLTRTQVQKLLESGNILVNGAIPKAKDSIAPGSKIEITLPDPAPLEIEPENIPLNILFEDEHLLVVNKPPGLTVHPSETQRTHTLVHGLLYHIKDLSGIGGKLRPGIVHRLDKDTSGALVITKTDEAHQGLSKDFATHSIQRKYWALCFGAPSWSQTRLQTQLGRNPNDRKKMAVLGSGGRTATSQFRMIEAFSQSHHRPFASWIEAELHTGRTHQVRVHLTHLGHSLLGDPVYGTPSSQQPKWKALPSEVQRAIERLPGQALHARNLGFCHPITKKQLFFEAEPFAEFQSVLDQCRLACRDS